MKSNLTSDRQTAVEDAQTARSLTTHEAIKESAESPSLCRVIISPEASRDLDEVTAKVNKLDGGKVNRSQILSSIVRYFVRHVADKEIQELRAEHFDKIAYLETLLKRAKETGVLPDELRSAIKPPNKSSKENKSLPRKP